MLTKQITSFIIYVVIEKKEVDNEYAVSLSNDSESEVKPVEEPKEEIIEKKDEIVYSYYDVVKFISQCPDIYKWKSEIT